MNPKFIPLRRIALFFVLSFAFLAGCSQQQSPEEADQFEYAVSFLGRTINLEPYVQGYPYSSWKADFEAGKLFYRHTTPEGVWMMVQDLKAHVFAHREVRYLATDATGQNVRVV